MSKQGSIVYQHIIELLCPRRDNFSSNHKAILNKFFQEYLKIYRNQLQEIAPVT